MDNLTAVRSLCNAMCNTFFADEDTIALILFNEEIPALDEATPKDVRIFRAALSLVIGYVESSRSEGGISTSVNEEAVKQSISYWCGIYGLDAEEELDNYVRKVVNGSNLW